MDCGAAALASICAYYKLQIPIARVRQYVNTDRRGTTLLGLVEGARRLGFEGKGVRIEKDGNFPEVALPAIAHILAQGKYPHYIVVYKVSKNKIQVMDPEKGELKTIPVKKFYEEWTGFMVLLRPGENFEKKKIGESNWRKFWQIVSPNKGNLLQLGLGALLYTVLGLATAIYIEKITDYVLPNYNGNLMNLLSIALILITTIQLVIGILRGVLNIKLGQIIDVKLILGYYKQLTELPQSFFNNMRTGEIISRINDAIKIRTFINDVAVTLLVNICIVVFSFILMFTYNVKMALILSISLPFYTLLYLLSNRLNKKTARTVMERSAHLESQLVESVNAMETIKVFNLQEFSNLKTEESFVDLLKSIYKVSVNNLRIFFAGDVFAKLLTIVLFWVGTYYIFKNNLTPGELFSLYSLIGYFTGPIASIVTSNRSIQEALIAADRLFEIMDLEKESDDDKISLKSGLQKIRFENVHFRYGSRAKVLNDLSFTIEPGTITALVGVSGSGKSTVVSLLLKLYTIDNGKIFIGEFDLKYVSTESLRSVVSVIPQTVTLFAGNIIENIAVGDPNPDIEKVVSICRQLELLEFIETLPSGFLTYIGENGTNLSGGQKQRLSIARALYRDFDILIMDEATSSLDSISDRVVQNVIIDLKKNNKTIIIVTHRLRSIMNADKIIVIKDGTVEEEGVHDDLVTMNGYYSQLWNQ
jgi:ATP-binding cassette subfamily B protein